MRTQPSTYSTSFGTAAFCLPRALNEGNAGIAGMGGGLEVDVRGGSTGDCISSDRGEVAESSCERTLGSLDATTLTNIFKYRQMDVQTVWLCQKLVREEC